MMATNELIVGESIFEDYKIGGGLVTIGDDYAAEYEIRQSDGTVVQQGNIARSTDATTWELRVTSTVTAQLVAGEKYVLYVFEENATTGYRNNIMKMTLLVV